MAFEIKTKVKSWLGASKYFGLPGLEPPEYYVITKLPTKDNPNSYEIHDPRFPYEMKAWCRDCEWDLPLLSKQYVHVSFLKEK